VCTAVVVDAGTSTDLPRFPMKTATLLSLVLASAVLAACSPWQGSTCDADGSTPAPMLLCEGAAPVAGPSGLPHTLNVTGVGVATSAPDVVHLQLGVQSRDADAGAALGANQGKLERVRAAFAGLGVAEKDVQVTSHTLVPQAEVDPNTGMQGPPTGFIADNMISVALRDPTRINEALGQVFAAGATSIQGVTFMLGDPQKLSEQARELAMADARARAEQIARAAGVTLGRPLSIQEMGGSTAMFPDLYGMAPSPMIPTPGQLQQSMSVSVSYTIP
jgi:uncharacterized protein YggE